MPTSARYISLNKCENQRPKAVQPATKQSTGLFLPNLQTNLEQLVVVRVQFKKTKKTEYTKVYSVHFGSPSWTRTNDPAVNSRMLYQLSY